MRLLADAVGLLAAAVTAAALVAATVALVSTRRPSVALSVLLDLLLAAGLLRLAGDPGWQTAATAAGIVVLRRLLGTGLRLGGGSWSPRNGNAAGSSRKLAIERLIRPAWFS